MHRSCVFVTYGLVDGDHRGKEHGEDHSAKYSGSMSKGFGGGRTIHVQSIVGRVRIIQGHLIAGYYCQDKDRVGGYKILQGMYRIGSQLLITMPRR